MKTNKILIGIFITLFTLFISLENVLAASATISVSANKSQVIVGDTVTVTVKVSSSQLLGSWRWSLDYNSSKFKLTSGSNPTVGYGDGKLKSKSYTYKFKAIATGSSSIGVKSTDLLDWSEKTLSVSKNSKTIKTITQSEYKATLSKNNNLSSLSIDGLTLSPTFKNSITEYKAQASANTTSIKINAKLEDSKSDLEGTGTFKVSEGENKFVITVTAQNGSTKKYTVVVNVTDPNPIEVNVNDKKYVVVKRESNLTIPDDYEKKEITINEQKVPGFYNEVTKFTLVGLKDENGDIDLFIYDENNNEYTLYEEALLDKVKLYPLPMDKNIENYSKSETNIGGIKFDSLKMQNSIYSIIHAIDLDSGEKDYYIYDSKTNTLITYNDENIKPYQEKIEKYKKILFILIIETIFIFLVLIGILINKVKRVKKLKLKQEELRKRKEESIKRHREKKEKEIKEEKKNK